MKKLTSLNQLRDELNLKPIKEKEEKPILCRKCGNEMKKIAENVWFCSKELTDKDGNILTEKDGSPKICGNRYIRRKKA